MTGKLKVKQVKKAMRDDIDNLIGALSKAVAGEVLRPNARQRDRFRDVLESEIGYETGEVFVSGEMDEGRISRLTGRLIGTIESRKEFENLEVKSLPRAKLIERVKEVLEVITSQY